MESILKTMPFLSDLLDTLSSCIFVFDKDVRIVYCNQAASHFTGKETVSSFLKLCGEALNCLNSQGDGLVCGQTRFCTDCVLRKCIATAFEGKKLRQVKANFKIMKDGLCSEAILNVSAFPLSHGDRSYAVAVVEDITEINELRSLLPICAWCKKIRDDRDYWHRVEDYLKDHMNVLLSHGICPECKADVQAQIKKRPL